MGKHISYLEIYKVVPTVLRLFDVSLWKKYWEVVWSQRADKAGAD